jgi:hypothetical protein
MVEPIDRVKREAPKRGDGEHAEHARRALAMLLGRQQFVRSMCNPVDRDVMG